MYETLKKAGINPIIHRIDNEYSKDLIEEIESTKLKYQIAPPGNHGALPAKRSIQTFKNYFESILNPSCMGMTLDTPKTNGTD